MIENHVENESRNRERVSSTASAVARCCHNAAAMLRVADQGVIDTKEKRASILAANEGQAKLLMQAAEIADEMLEALEEAAAWIKELDGGDMTTETGWKSGDLLDVWLKLHAAIDKADGRQP